MSDHFVLLKWTEHRNPQPDDVSVHAVYHTKEEMDARLERIAEANKQYPMEQIGANLYRMGPTEDEGFFGNSPVWLKVVEK